jgi:hypothetical protein
MLLNMQSICYSTWYSIPALYLQHTLPGQAYRLRRYVPRYERPFRYIDAPVADVIGWRRKWYLWKAYEKLFLAMLNSEKLHLVKLCNLTFETGGSVKLIATDICKNTSLHSPVVTAPLRTLRTSSEGIFDAV